MAESLKQKTFKGTIWSAVENFSVQGIQFIVMLIMARILSPSDYGILGMISIFIAICGTFVSSGFSNALIRKENRTEKDNSTVFYFNIIISFILYLFLFFSAPLIAKFYNMPQLTLITRVVSLSLILGAFGIVQRTQYTIKIDFKTQAKASLSAAIISGATGITLAYIGWGVWALVAQQLVSIILNTLLLWIFSSWRPRWMFSWVSLKEMFSFGSKLLASNLIDTIYKNIYSLVIGKIYKAADLGFYSRSKSFSQFASSNITSIVQRVTFPVLCTLQNDTFRLQEGYRNLLKVSAYIVFPLMMGMAAVAKPMVISLITEKWIYSAVLLVPICFAGMWYPVHAINLSLLQVKGRSDLFLRLEIIKKILGISVLLITIPMGLYAMCWGSFFSSILCLLINTHYTGKLINVGFFKQMKDLIPIFLLSFGMGAIVWFTMKILPLPNPALLAIGVVEGIIIFLLGSIIFRFPELKEIISLIKNKG